MNIYETEDDEDVLDTFLRTLEKDTKKLIFTMKILSHDEKGLESIVVFEDKTVLYGFISTPVIGEKMALRMQGNWI